MRKILSLLLVLVMALTIFPMSAFADSVLDSGECGDQGGNVIWTFYQSGKLVISGTGRMKDGINNNGRIEKPVGPYAYGGDWPRTSSIEITEGITHIGAWAFCADIKATTVSIPNSVVSIGEGAFSGSGLVSVRIPSSVKSIGDMAFDGCGELISVYLPNSITSIGVQVFAECDKLNSIDIPNSVKSIGKFAFSGCDSLTSVTIPNSVTNIGEAAFMQCEGLISIILPKSVTSIGDCVVANCFVLKDVFYCGTQDQFKTINVNTDYRNTYLMKHLRYNYVVKQKCTTHTYTSASGDVCTVCGYVYSPTKTPVDRLMYVTKANSPLRSNYYSKNGNTISNLPKGYNLNIAYSFYNSLGSLWYETDDGKYIYSEYVKVFSNLKLCKLSFNVNGGYGNFENFEKTTVSESAVFKIPSSYIPTRDGYTFLGWSPSLAANGQKYQPGESITIEGDLTLYAVWKSPPKSSLTASLTPAQIEKINSIPGVAQNQNGDKGTCTTATVAVMFARRQVVDGVNPTFTYNDVKSSYNGCFNLGSDYTSGDSVYKLSSETYSSLPTNKDERTKHIVSLLDEHPEGIVLYYKYSTGKHAIVLSDYEIKDDGSYQFYAYDSWSSKELGRYKLEEISSFKANFKGQTYEALFNALNDGKKSGNNGGFAGGQCIWYVKTEG